jgi:hypothetical protein
VITAGTGRNNQTTAVFAIEAFVAGMGLVIALIILLAFVFSVHSNTSRIDRYNYYIIDAESVNM